MNSYLNAMDDTASASATVRIECFDRPAEAKSINRSVIEVIEEWRTRQVSRYISEDNFQRYNHGGAWSHPAHEHAIPTRNHCIESVWVTPWQSLVDNDLGIIARTMRPMLEDMDRQFAQHLYGMIGDAAASVGNVVDNNVEGSIANSLLAVWQKIEIGVDRDGNVSLPQLHVHPKTWEKMQAALKDQPPEFHAKVDQIIHEKSLIALENERQRKARFAGQDEI